MANLAATIKTMIKEYLQNEALCNVLFGTYLDGSVKIDGKPVTVPADMVSLPQHIKGGIQSGDRVAVVQAHGGQKYVILGRFIE